MPVANLCLIEQHITDKATSDPHRRNEPVFKRTGTPVWVVVGYCLRACDGSVELAAQDYGLTQEEVQAALTYYQQHPELDVCREEASDSAAETLSGRMHLGSPHGAASAA
jgi:uncharacterized protein (DUF433 family)